jgi:hypothetical protein
MTNFLLEGTDMTTESVSSSGFVTIPVPVDRVAEVYALLGQPAAPTATPKAPSIGGSSGTNGAVWTPPGEEDDTDVHPWTAATLRRMYTESATNMRAALDYLAERGDQDVTSNELAKVLHLPKGAASVAGMIGAFARRCWSRYDRYLPWTSRWQYIDEQAGTTETVFRMPEPVAEVLRSLRENAA